MSTESLLVSFVLTLWAVSLVAFVWALRTAEPDPNAHLPFCEGCPDHEACSQGACYLDGGPVAPGARRG